MTAYALLQTVVDTELWKSYTPEWREWKKQETPEIEWKYWLKSEPWRSCPAYFLDYFCDSHNKGYWKFSEQWNHRVCNECGRLPMKLWPLFVFECDECEEPFMIKQYPVHYHLCVDCGGG